MNFLGFKAPVTVGVEFFKGGDVKPEMVTVRSASGVPETVPLYTDGDTVSGVVTITTAFGKKVDADPQLSVPILEAPRWGEVRCAHQMAFRNHVFMFTFTCMRFFSLFLMHRRHVICIMESSLMFGQGTYW